MNGYETIVLTRDCEAVVIPAGTHVMLQMGQQVVVTQSLGGSHTVNVNGNLVRIAAKDADALGKTSAPQGGELAPPAGALDAVAPSTVSEESVWEQLKTCFDPEIPANIVDLGLIYSLKIEPVPPPQAGSRVDIKMTLTAPGCGMGDVLKEDVQGKVISIPGVESCHVEMVTEPQWNQAMMSDAAKLQLGMF